jgi:pimeloyl-ACP methyl ester carboxylesterase
MRTTDRRLSTANKPGNGLAFAAGAVLGAPVALAGGWLVYSTFVLDHHLPLPPAIEAEQYTLTSDIAGALNVYVDRSGAGRPLLLIHSVNAAASACEMRPIFDHYRGQRPVYALDLPGYGLSDRTDAARTPEAFAAAIVDVIDMVIGEPADVIALSLGGEFAARAAVQRPDLFHSLAFISPTGFNASGTGRATQQAVEQDRTESAYRLLANPAWAQALFDLIATRRSIEFFLKQSFVGPVPPALIDYAYATAHQPGAQYTPLRFISGQLFTREARSVLYERLTQPVLVIYDRDAYSTFDALPAFVAGRGAEHVNWQTARIEPTRGLPHFETMPRVADALDDFWRGL